LIRYRSSLGDALVVIDARPAAAFHGVMAGEKIDADRAGHIPGAINVPWQLNVTDSGEFRTKEELQKLYAAVPMTRNTSIITYCRTGVEASMTYFVLRYLGLDPSLYDGSYYEWSRDLTVAMK
jgi:thiosulfate/3-mercaptopyruvate sulfurtransferase